MTIATNYVFFVANGLFATLNKSDAIRCIQTHSKHHIQPQSKARFIEAVETELLSLHEGNFARYKVRPSEFYRWYERWRA